MIGLKDVADRAGVSASTVSRVLAGKSYVNDLTRQRVWEAIDHLNYRPNTLAQSLKSGSSNTLALVIPSIQNQMFPHLVQGAEDAARQAGYTLVLCNTDEDVEVEQRYIDTLRSHLTAGFIFATMMPTSDHIRRLREDGMPIVLTSRSYGDAIDAVLIDNSETAYRATKYLLAKSRGKVAIALGNTDLGVYADRLKGYRKALAEASLADDSSLILANGDQTEQLYADVRALLQKDKQVDSIFATNDQKAFVVMRAIHDEGLKIPEDVAVIGLDNVEMSQLIEPPLTTMAQPLYNMGKLAVEKILRIIKYKEEHGSLPEPLIDVLATELIIRKSTREEK